MTGKEIYDLIKGFDTPTKKNFSRYCKTAYASSSWLYLYRQIAKAKTFDEAKIRGKKLRNNNDYWAARMQLLRQLLTSLYLFRQNGDLLEDDRLEIAKDHCMFDFLANQLKKEFKEAREKGRLWRIMELEEIREKLRLIPRTVVNEIFSNEEAAEAMQEVAEIAVCKQAILQYRIFMKTGVNDLEGRKALAEEIGHKVSIQVGKSNVLHAYRLRVLVGVANLRMDFDQVAVRREKLVNFLLSVQPILDVAKLIIEISYLIRVLISLNLGDRARKYLSILQKIKPNTPFEKNLKKVKTGDVGIYLAAGQFDLELFKVSMELVDEENGNFGYFQILGATLAFYVGDFSYSSKMLRSVINMRKEVWTKYAWYILPLEAMIRYEQGRFDFVETLISRMRARKKFDEDYTKLMLSTLTSLIKKEPNKRNSILEVAIQKFQIYSETADGKSKVPKFDFGVWLHSQKNLLPMSEIIQSREKDDLSFDDNQI